VSASKAKFVAIAATGTKGLLKTVGF